ncbi:hypothetical protein [Pseudomonas aeruginosa]|uniref:hypothetical protein n=1 Tax=Pseudomonas aeruginosa TaxID=287 RepID=UPI001ADAE91C|nr:hypothetical protein [Pseudomonas aeruginosa]MBO8337067.1 hypothetical protein [Pseudomonas aeruginosa]HCF4080888.1 hypothetical protein [Pseudomonas aeruginosa]
MRVIHRGVELNQAQIDAIVPLMNDFARGLIRGKKKLEAAIDKALEEAGCPLENPVVTLR